MTIDRGILSALGAAVLFGIATPLAKLLTDDVTPLLLAGLLYFGSGLGLALVLAVRMWMGGASGISWPRAGDVWWLLAAIAAGGVAGPYLLMLGLTLTDAASASLILNFEGVLTALLAWFVFRENFDRRIAIGMALIVAGGVVLALGPAPTTDNLLGPLAIVGACLAWAIDNNLTRKVSIHDATVIAGTKGLVAGSTSTALALSAGAEWPGMSVVSAAAVVGFVGYGLSLTLFVFALRSLGTARTGAYFSVAPFAGAAFALLLGAPISGPLLVAGLLMAIGVWLHLTEHHAHKHTHETLTHAHPHTHDAHHEHTHDADWDGREPHAHVHTHDALTHTHPHYPDVHHRHAH